MCFTFKWYVTLCSNERVSVSVHVLIIQINVHLTKHVHILQDTVVSSISGICLL